MSLNQPLMLSSALVHQMLLNQRLIHPNKWLSCSTIVNRQSRDPCQAVILVHLIAYQAEVGAGKSLSLHSPANSGTFLSGSI